MDIKHLEYFTTIVENNFNLSRAANVLLISQPALTKFIKEFEEQEDVSLFIRAKGRLIGLTPIGKEFYDNALIVISNHQQLMEHLRLNKDTIKGSIKIGIPPVILTILFKRAIPHFIIENPDIQLEIVEAGAYDLQKMLLLQEIDIAFLIDPIDTPNITYKPVVSDEAVVIFNDQHQLSQENDAIDYSLLSGEKIVLLNDSFMLHHHIKKNFRVADVTPYIFFESGAWDLLVSMCESLNMVTILPKPIISHYPQHNLLFRPLVPPLKWTVNICRLGNVHHNHLTTYTENFFLDYFKENTN